MSDIKTNAEPNRDFGNTAQRNTHRGARRQALANELALGKKIEEKQKDDPTFLDGKDPYIVAHVAYMLG